MRKPLSKQTQYELETTACNWRRVRDHALADAINWPGPGWDDVRDRFVADERRLDEEFARRHSA